MRARRPAVFIGSSSEGLDVVNAIQQNLDRECEITPWHQGVFGLGEGTLETLVAKASEFDFAILVITPDDMTRSRGQRRQTPRDNVLLELGLFLGVLGRRRTFVVFDRSADIKLPTDLAGVGLADYQPHANGNLQASVGAATTLVLKAIRDLGPRERPVAAEGVPGITGLHHVSLPVRDLERSKGFYQDVLRLQPITNRPPFPFLGHWFELPSGQHLHLTLNPNGTFRSRPDIDPRDSHFAIQTRDWREMQAYLNSKKIEMKVDPYLMGLLQLYILDPDGYVIEINALGVPDFKTKRG